MCSFLLVVRRWFNINDRYRINLKREEKELEQNGFEGNQEVYIIKNYYLNISESFRTKSNDVHYQGNFMSKAKEVNSHSQIREN